MEGTGREREREDKDTATGMGHVGVREIQEREGTLYSAIGQGGADRFRATHNTWHSKATHSLTH